MKPLSGNSFIENSPVMDNAPIHTSNVVNNKQVEWKMRFETLGENIKFILPDYLIVPLPICDTKV